MIFGNSAPGRLPFGSGPGRGAGRPVLWGALVLHGLLLVLTSARATAGGPVPVGTYLYSDAADHERHSGSLTVTFTGPGDRLVVAYGRRHRKGRRSRQETTEAERVRFKPVKARLDDGGRVAVFEHLPPDYYDLVVFDTDAMAFYEGLQLIRGGAEETSGQPVFEAVRRSLSSSGDRIGGWEAFFDTKQFERLERSGGSACVLVQQMRLGKAFAESGAQLQGCIHSVDLCWVAATRAEDGDWQVVTRQQLFREELRSRDFFRHVFLSPLRGIRIGRKSKRLGPFDLPGGG